MRPLFFIPAVALLSLLAVPPPASSAAWQWPLTGEVITAYLNGSDPYTGGQHRGIDIAGPLGAEVVAAAGGEVLFAGTAGSSGTTVSVRTAEGLDTSYLHLSAPAVRKGDRVGAGDRIGAVGTSGTRSAEVPHLHFGVRESGSRHAYRDPLSLLPPPPAGAPREPAPAPSPVPAPVDPVASPAPLPQTAPRRIPAPRRVPARPRVPAARRVPARRPVARRVPAGRPVPKRQHVPAHGGAPALDPLPATEPAPAGARLEGRPGHARGEARASAPELGRPHVPTETEGLRRRAEALRGAEGPSVSPAAAGSGSSSVAPQRAEALPRSSPGDGPDLGWAAACAGLLLAAAILGLTDDGRKAARRSGGRLAGMVRPLLGRR